jgi:hypothetical protein
MLFVAGVAVVLRPERDPVVLGVAQEVVGDRRAGDGPGVRVQVDAVGRGVLDPQVRQREVGARADNPDARLLVLNPDVRDPRVAEPPVERGDLGVAVVAHVDVAEHGQVRDNDVAAGRVLGSVELDVAAGQDRVPLPRPEHLHVVDVERGADRVGAGRQVDALAGRRRRVDRALQGGRHIGRAGAVDVVRGLRDVDVPAGGLRDRRAHQLEVGRADDVPRRVIAGVDLQLDDGAGRHGRGELVAHVVVEVVRNLAVGLGDEGGVGIRVGSVQPRKLRGERQRGGQLPADVEVQGRGDPAALQGVRDRVVHVHRVGGSGQRERDVLALADELHGLPAGRFRLQRAVLEVGREHRPVRPRVRAGRGVVLGEGDVGARAAGRIGGRRRSRRGARRDGHRGARRRGDRE